MSDLAHGPVVAAVAQRAVAVLLPGRRLAGLRPTFGYGRTVLELVTAEAEGPGVAELKADLEAIAVHQAYARHAETCLAAAAALARLEAEAARLVAENERLALMLAARQGGTDDDD